MTVQELIIELLKFDLNNEVNAYEGDSVGLNVFDLDGNYGFIYTEENKPTERIKE